MAKDETEEVIEETKIPVLVVETRGPSVVVIEYDNGQKRAIVPAKDVHANGTIAADKLSLGQPYGMDWESIITLSATPKTLAKSLRDVGVWTLQDLETKQAAAFGAIQAAYGLDFGRLLQAAQKHNGGK